MALNQPAFKSKMIVAKFGVKRYKALMKEILRTNDLVRLSWAAALLAEHHIDAVTLDAHTSVVEGSIGAIQRRLMVLEEDYEQACRLIKEADPVYG